jgi:hypothetical protein
MPTQRPPPAYSPRLFRHLPAVLSARRLDQWLWVIHPEDHLASTRWWSIHVSIDSTKLVTFIYWDLFSSLKTSTPKLSPPPHVPSSSKIQTKITHYIPCIWRQCVDVHKTIVSISGTENCVELLAASHARLLVLWLSHSQPLSTHDNHGPTA